MEFSPTITILSRLNQVINILENINVKLGAICESQELKVEEIPMVKNRYIPKKEKYKQAALEDNNE